MSPKEARRVYVMEQLLQGKLTVRQASQLLGLSERQVKRLKGGMKQQGVAFLAHKNRGRKPKHAVPEEVSSRVVTLAQHEFQGASCVHMAELLAQYEGINLSPRTIRRILANAGIPNPHGHKASRRRRSRDRLPQEGLLVQCDASPYAWLENRGPKLALLGAIDDATGKILGLCFRPEEDTLGYLQLLSQILTHHGVPHALYSDRHTIFFSPKNGKLSIEEELAGKQVPLTQFGRALDELHIRHIPARSPQAKGRVERLWGTLQHRLIIELRLAGVSTLEEANAFLPGFIARFNERFATEPADPQPAYRPCPPQDVLRRILCLKHDRKATRGSTISYNGQMYQLVDRRGNVVPLRPHATVTVLTHLDGTTSALYEGKPFSLLVFSQTGPSTKPQSRPQPKGERAPYRPPQDHPWRVPLWVPRQARDPVQDYFEAKSRSKFWQGVYAQR